MSKIFLSHSSKNNLQAIGLRDWLSQEGWEDVFLDIDPNRGLKAGERWEDALRLAANRCECVIFLISKEWLSSQWCRDEFNLARHLNKRLFGLLIEDISKRDLPSRLTSEWQVANLIHGREKVHINIIVPPEQITEEVIFSLAGLEKLKLGLVNAGLDANYFKWPPDNDPNRPPYRGLRPFEGADAGIYFGRESSILEVLDELRSMRYGGQAKLLIIVGASGAGKSSFMRAGILPRLQRDASHYYCLPIVRPERAAVSGSQGLIRSLETAFHKSNLKITRSDLRRLVANPIELSVRLVQLLESQRSANALEDGTAIWPSLIIPIDQSEELFNIGNDEETEELFEAIKALLISTKISVIPILTIRSDQYEELQNTKSLESVTHNVVSLSTMPRGNYKNIIDGPALRLRDTNRSLSIQSSLIELLLTDIDEGDAKDSLPLLAFTMQRLYSEYGGCGELTVENYNELGGIRGSIEAALQSVFNEADLHKNITTDYTSRLALLRNAFIPWLVGIDVNTGLPRRRVANLEEIPSESRPLIMLMVDQRLLISDTNSESSEVTIEVAHEALLRQWRALHSWLSEDSGLLGVLEGVRIATRDWVKNKKEATWITHGGARLLAARSTSARSDFMGRFSKVELDYLHACEVQEKLKYTRKMRAVSLIVFFGFVMIAGGLAWWNQDGIIAFWFKNFEIRPYVLNDIEERNLKPLQTFRECKEDCPEMVVIPDGDFMMGVTPDKNSLGDNRIPRHRVNILKMFAVSRFTVTFDDWDNCVRHNGCKNALANDFKWGRGRQPVVGVSWADANEYTEWLTSITNREYRLLSEAEWEYAARGKEGYEFPLGNKLLEGTANCNGCDSKWDNIKPAPVGSFRPNSFGLYDMHGNVWEWCADNWHPNYIGAPNDGSAWLEGDSAYRVIRGGSWLNVWQSIRSSNRSWTQPSVANKITGFRIARSLGGS